MNPTDLLAAIEEAYLIRQAATWQQAHLMDAFERAYGALPLANPDFTGRLGYEYSSRSALRLGGTWALRQSGVYVPELTFQHHFSAGNWEDPVAWLTAAMDNGWTANNMRVMRSRRRHGRLREKSE